MSSEDMDIPLTDIYNLLEGKKKKINHLNDITKQNREKLRLINQNLDRQQEELLKLIIYITDSEQDVSSLDSKEVLSNENVMEERLNRILDNLRKIRISLVEIIREG
jgi:hypothetical protein